MPKNKNKTKNSYSKRIILGFVAVAVVAVGFFAAEKIKDFKEDPVKVDSLTTAERGDHYDDIGLTGDVTEVNDDNEKTPIKYDGDDPNLLNELTGTVTFAGVAGDKVLIRVSIDQFLDSGSCVLTLGEYSDEAEIAASASTSTCQGFDIPLSSLSDMSGKVNFIIDLSSGDKSGRINGSFEL